jgi:predicted short-subunit dehydrogenase-like oxidoreductase (DUF2520 family)
MDVAIVGPGRVGTLLAIALAATPHRVTAVAGGSAESRQRLRDRVAGLRDVTELPDVAAQARLLVLAVPDDAIETCATELALADVLRPHHRVVHVAGSRGVRALRRAEVAGASVAACHPAMTVPVGALDRELLVGVAWAVSAAPNARGWAHELVRDLGGDPHDLPEDRRALYHAALAVGSNAVTAAAALARQLLLAAGIDDPAAFLAPLAHASVENGVRRGAVALTGPIARGDTGTIAAHLDALERDLPELVSAYRAHAAATLELARRSLDPAAAAALAALLTAEAGEQG